ncbi:MAG: UDP-N-acetylmuramoyl-L-alanine--D-glutamate ligase [Phycisphaerae bacterium]
MGLGRFGGGVGVTRWLVQAGAHVTLTDRLPADKLPALEQLADLDCVLHLGGHDKADFRETDLVVVNPAVPDRAPVLEAARAAGVPLTTEINLFAERCPAPVVGITGSVGKSTTSAMIGHVLSRTRTEGRVWLGGNIGRSLLDDLAQMAPGDVVVLELSSFQLERTPLIRWSPRVAVITNITPNHMDWHGDFAAYAAAKLNIARFQNPATDAVILEDQSELRRLFAEQFPERRPWTYGLEDGEPVARCGDQPALRWPGLRLDVPGQHNRLNAGAALTAAHALGMPADAAARALADFEALPDRLQRVAVRDGVTYYNDSKSTTPEAAITAMQAVSAPLLMILGGYDKGVALDGLARHAAERARFAACIGQTGTRLAETIQTAGGEAEVCPDLTAAFAACQQRATTGDVVLLSPGCASWDQFEDYRVRGEVFTRLARGGA